MSREGNLLAGFLVGVVLAFVGSVADDLRLLLVIGGPLAVACVWFLKNKLLAPTVILALIALRSAVAVVATGSPLMGLLGIVCGAAALMLLRIASRR